MGRPTKYKEEYCGDLIQYMSKGMPYQAFAGYIGVAISTLYEWEKEYKDFSDAKKIGQGKSLEYMVELAHSQMIDGKLNNTAWIFMMKNMHGWRDKQEIESTVTSKVVNLVHELDED